MNYSVVIPAYQAAKTLSTVIAAWRTMTPAPESILVIDDGSSDGTGLIAEREGVPVVAMPRNSGRGAARARGMEAAQTPLVLMCDTTMIPTEEFVARAIPWFAEAKVVAVIAHITQGASRTFVDRWRGRHLFKPEPPPVNRQALLATGICILRRDAVGQVGGFDAVLRAGEDTDLGRRLLAAGWDVVADPSVRAISLSTESAHALLARYARWNSPHGIRGKDWLRQVAYAVKVMARQDLQAGDPLGVLLSLASPFYQLRCR
jgi:glycosyltransferase involved in cell wall biosynthesis